MVGSRRGVVSNGGLSVFVDSDLALRAARSSSIDAPTAPAGRPMGTAPASVAGRQCRPAWVHSRNKGHAQPSPLEQRRRLSVTGDCSAGPRGRLCDPLWRGHERWLLRAGSRPYQSAPVRPTAGSYGAPGDETGASCAPSFRAEAVSCRACWSLPRYIMVRVESGLVGHCTLATQRENLLASTTVALHRHQPGIAAQAIRPTANFRAMS